MCQTMLAVVGVVNFQTASIRMRNDPA